MNIRSVFSNFLINNFYFYPHYTLCIINWSIFPSIQSSFDDLLKSITSIQTDTWNSKLHGEFLSELLGTFHTLLHTDVLDWDKRTHIQGSHSWMLTYQKIGYTCTLKVQCSCIIYPFTHCWASRLKLHGIAFVSVWEYSRYIK